MKVERLSTKCDSLDDLMGGGIEYETVTNVYGPAGCGKTNFCLQTSVSCVEDGSKVVFIDTEGSFSKERVGQIADDPKEVMDNIVLYEPRNFEEQEKTIENVEDVCKEKDIGLLVLDSLVTLYRLELNGDNIKDVNSRLAKQLSKLSNISREYGIPVLITNQIYADIENGGVELVSRDIAKYQSKCLLEIKKFEKGKRLAVLRKHRSLPEGKEAQFVITENGLETPGSKFNIFKG
ncbi:MAG: DNA repair and recombination protein RadB [Candidatus Aenigmatarchaeota archaeon]